MDRRGLGISPSFARPTTFRRGSLGLLHFDELRSAYYVNRNGAVDRCLSPRAFGVIHRPMLAIGYAAALRGIDAYVVRVEVVGVPVADPSIHIVGLADRAIQESKERVNAAVRSSGFLFPTYKVVVNLAP